MGKFLGADCQRKNLLAKPAFFCAETSACWVKKPMKMIFIHCKIMGKYICKQVRIQEKQGSFLFRLCAENACLKHAAHRHRIAFVQEAVAAKPSKSKAHSQRQQGSHPKPQL